MSTIRVDAHGTLGEAAAYGVSRLQQQKGDAQVICAVAGTPQAQEIAARGVALPQGAEAFSLAPLGKGEYAVLGSDDNGLMYGCFELAERLAAEGTAQAVCQSPFVKTRGIYKFLHNEDCEKDWFYDKAYWTKTFDSMAYDRYNSYNLVFSHQTSYLAPMFAYFLNMPEFPEVYAANADAQVIARNREMLLFISRYAAKRGIDFIVGIWQVCPWKGGEQDWRATQPTFVKGLTKENLPAYTYAGMKKLIAEYPDIKGLQIRANEESGIPREIQSEFFHNTLFKAMRECGRPFIFDFRCWMAEKATLQDALQYPGTRLSCKYWAEFMGAPYQPAKTSPGYSYSDVLQQPLPCDFIWQVWTLGSPRLLLWGDPEYAKRFVHSLKLGGGTGFELNMLMAQKGYGNEPGNWRIMKNREDEYYQFEDERHWLFQTLMGRFGYNPDCGAGAYMAALTERFGALAADVARVYQSGSDIITFLTHYSLSDPNMYIWPEIDLGGVLDFYMQTPTPDACVLKTIPEQVEEEFSGQATGRFTPMASAARFEEKASATLSAIAALENKRGAVVSKELDATLTDFKVMAFLGLYHAAKTRAALSLMRWYKSMDIALLRDCSDHMRTATGCWERMVALTQNVYNGFMVTGPTDAGSWKTKLTFVYEDELRVQEMLRLYEGLGAFAKGFDFGAQPKGPMLSAHRAFPMLEDYSIERGFSLASQESRYSAQVGFGFESGDPSAIPMPLVRLNDNHIEPLRRDMMIVRPTDQMKGWRSPLFEDALTGEGPAVFRVDLPDGAYEVTLLLCDRTPTAGMRGPFSARVGTTVYNDVTLQPMKEKTLVFPVAVSGAPVRLHLDGNWFLSGLVIRTLAPAIRSMPRGVLAPGDTVTATAAAPSGIAACALVLTQNGAQKRLPMAPVHPGAYAARIEALQGAGEGSYHIEVKACDGLLSCSPEVRFLAAAGPSAISLVHDPVASAVAGQDVLIKASVSSAYPLKAVRLHHTCGNHYLPVKHVDMTLRDGQWQGVIPGGDLDPHYIHLYWFDAVDATGEGILSPDFRRQTPYHVMKVGGAL